MAFLYSFSDDILYGTDDINSITARLMGAGVSPFDKKESYTDCIEECKKKLEKLDKKLGVEKK